MSRSFERAPRQKEPSVDSFADKLLGPKTEKLESPDRTARSEKPGREFTTNRGGKRSDERDLDSESSSELRNKKSKPQKGDEQESVYASAQNAHSSVRDSSTQPKPESRDVSSRVSAGDSPIGNSPVGMPARSEGTQVAQITMRSQGSTLGAAEISGQERIGAADLGTLDLVEKLRANEAVASQQAMETFMLQMREELGVPPDQVLQAFAEMNPGTLLSSPELATEEFVSNLPPMLPHQSTRAADLYNQMVQKTGEAAISQKLVGLEAGVNVEVLSKDDLALARLNKGLDELNSSFFLKGAPQQQGSNLSNTPLNAAENLDAQLAQLMRARAQGQGASEKKDGDSDELASLLGGVAMGAAALEKDGLSATDADLPEGSLKSLNMDLNAVAPELESGASVVSKAGQQSESSFDQQSEQKGFSSELTGAELSSEADAGSFESFGLNGAAGSQPAPASGLTRGAAVAAPATMMAAAPSSQDEAENVQELIKQAQIVLKRGGGEMKLEMKPEGLGQVHLRVAVENGQVNVQMLTENDAAKKLIEKGLHELKASLSAQQLQVDNLKVDIGSEIQKQMDQHNQEQAREQARQFAQDFLGQFREEREAFRQGFMENSGWRSYGRGQNRAEIEPDPVVSASARRSDGSKRLNLVA